MKKGNQLLNANTAIYQIKIQGKLDQRWSDWFNGLSITTEGDFSLLTGVVADQAKLRGILSRVWDLNLQVVSVAQIDRFEDAQGKKEMNNG